MLRLVLPIDCRDGAERAAYRQDFLPVLTECWTAGNVRRMAALSHDNNPADQIVSDSSKYMRVAPRALDFDRFESLEAPAPGLFL
jgi:hypothetical protein